MRSYVAAFTLIVAGVPTLAAERAALLIGNSDYRQIENVRQGDRALRPSANSSATASRSSRCATPPPRTCAGQSKAMWNRPTGPAGP